MEEYPRQLDRFLRFLQGWLPGRARISEPRSYSVKGVTSSTAGASVPSIRVHSSPNSSRLWVFRKAESCHVRIAFVAFFATC